MISLHQAGINNVVASSGTSLTDSQIRLLQRFTKNVTVLYDGDSAGIKAAMRGVDMLLSQDLNVRVVQFPDDHDPDSYVQEVGGEAFKGFLKEESKDFILFKTKLYLAESADDPLKRGEAVRDIVRSIAKIPDPIKRTVFYQQCSDLLGVGEELLATEGDKIIEEEKKRAAKQAAYQRKKEERKTQGNAVSGKSAPSQPISTPDSIEDLENFSFSEEDALIQLPDGEYFEGGGAVSEEVLPPTEVSEGLDILRPDPALEAISNQEKESIRLLLQYGEASIDGENFIADYLLSEIDSLEFQNPIYKEVIEALRKQKSEGKPLNPDRLLSHENPKVREAISSLLMQSSQYELSPNWWERHQIFVPEIDSDLGLTAYKNVLRLKFRMLKRLVDQANTAIKEAKNIAHQTECIKIQMELKSQENAIAKILGINIS